MTTKADEAVAAWRSHDGRAFLARIREAGKPWLAKRTVALYTLVEGGRPVLHGSGVLLRIAEVSFLISAGHVLVAGEAKDTMLLISPGTTDSHFIPLHGIEIQHSVDKQDIDIGFVRLTQDMHDTLVKHKCFLRLSDLDLSVGPEPEGWFSVVGFPSEYTSFYHASSTIKSDALYYSTVRYRGRSTIILMAIHLL